MESKKWKMQETFAFPEHAGMPVGAKSIKVTPGYTEKRTNDSIRLSGIYHIAVNLNFDDQQKVERIPESAVFVGDVEVDGNTGYFEYAVPLNIDLPADVQGPLHVSASNAKCEADGQGSFDVIWHVECFQQAAAANAQEAAQTAQVKETVAVDEPAVQEKAQPVAAEKKTEKPVVASAEEKPAEQQVVSAAEDSKAIAKLEQEAEEPKEEVAQVEEVLETAEAMADDFEEEAAQEPKAVATHSTPYSEQDEALAFIAGLADGVSTSTFRSNDIFVQHKS